MKNKVIKKISLVFLSLFFCFLTYKLCYFIAEKYFFDKFIYRKSTKYGYNDKPNFNQSDFGERYRDLLFLNSGNPLAFNNYNVNNSYIIAVIGDSYVWGLGIKNNQRFASILEKKLNSIKPTKIISLGEMGNSTLDYYRHYNQLKKYINVNLYLFVLVNNDAFLSRNQQDQNDIIKNCTLQFPKTEPIYEIYGELISKGYNLDQKSQTITDITNQAYFDSWHNPINRCVVKDSVKFLPENSMFFITDNYTHKHDAYYQYQQILLETNRSALSSEVGETTKKYQKYWNNPFYYFRVSSKEAHPNALANQLYADLLYQEITTNPKWGFIK